MQQDPGSSEAFRGAAIVDARLARRQLHPLGMQCDSKEIPEPILGANSDAYWIAEAGAFSGSASSAGETGVLGPTVDARYTGTITVTVVADRLLGIVAPEEVSRPSVWFTSPVRELEVVTSGSVGILKKRPSAIVIDSGDWEVELHNVSKLLRRSGRYQTGQEASLVAALGG